MSLESALDEERKEIMQILEGRPAQPRSPAITGRSSPSPAPVRSMLDVAGPSVPRHGSIAGTGVGVTNPTSRTGLSSPTVRSMLDPNSPPPTQSTHSTNSSASSLLALGGSHHRTQSDAASHPSDVRSRGASERNKSAADPLPDYQFEMLPSVQNQALPKRVSQGGKKQINSMAAIMQGQELSPFPRGRDRGRHNSTAGIMGGKSRSPSSRLINRSQSPGGSLLNTNSYNPMTTPGKFVTDGGKVIDMNSAYRRLSDAALLNSGGTLSNLPTRSASGRARLDSGETLSPSGEVRMQKDYYIDDDNEEGAVESSDEEQSSGDENWGPQSVRGRRKGRRKKGVGGGEGDTEESESSMTLRGARRGQQGTGKAGAPTKVKSLLAAAEEERINVSSQYKVKSMLEPAVTVTPPGGEKLPAKKIGVHPSTNYNQTASGRTSPGTSDSEELNDIRRAQKLNITMSPVDSSIPHRVIRTIIRGEFSKMQQEAEEGSRRLRTYLVATDLSGEAAYALEWTIGTVLRDGDTLIAVYAVDEEVGTGKSGDPEDALPIGDGGLAMQETADLVGRLTAASQNAPPITNPSPLSGISLATAKDSRAGSVDSRNMSKAEQERFHAIEDLSQTCIKFLRKTRLQVRVAVEVIHCKSPKHMITEAIDGLEPTLVILGSRGRSALKGVLLGSFSNYLVTKSSVPVMVARKRLQKPSAKHKAPNVRLANNLTPSRRLEEAKID